MCFSGHRVDAPGRREPRLPPEALPEVGLRIRGALEVLQPALGISSAANGSDILFLEAMQAIGAEVEIVLPLADEAFVARSVEHPSDPGWPGRFRVALRAAARVHRLNGDAMAPGRAFRMTNDFLLACARQRAREQNRELVVLAAWDGRPGDGEGGTAALVAAARRLRERVEILPLPAAEAGV